MAHSRKKVLVRTLDHGLYSGYLPGSRLLDASGSVDLLDLEGRHAPIPVDTVRWVAYVRDFNRQDSVDPERLGRRVFHARPRTEGLWVRLTLLGGESLDGLASLDLSLADGFLQDKGIFIIPPDTRSNTQRLFVPRTALAGMQILTVVTTRSKSMTAGKPGAVQDNLFP